MNVAKLYEMVEKNVIPAVRELLKKLPGVKRVFIQLDGAGGHGGGKGDMAKVLEKLNQLGLGKRGQPNIIFVKQPARSPDFNSLDLGFWFALASGVQVQLLIARRKGVRWEEQIIEAVLARWNSSSFDATGILSDIFDTKVRIVRLVHKLQGSNEYEIPRSGKKARKERTSFDPAEIGEATPKRQLSAAFEGAAAQSEEPAIESELEEDLKDDSDAEDSGGSDFDRFDAADSDDAGSEEEEGDEEEDEDSSEISLDDDDGEYEDS